ncbi:Amino acid ABC transporter, amino acid-binding and permease protein [Alteracholeplasma palmae J233]|uniref:Amino acid ABC transporter, amino acid-binding and permease protein n=1 Tax=Alteracholeplasma palmae (strain ATCC 49389 / J233) TaxID=1318466 RepID=U4KKA5_ALTPJ|nr:amino acid ABC transporter permease [Alteracholeplasma palmae]CCV63997.1 Amino acid ABC transporter, amino acid-binding and permease protein [Alteracholeplasma palmae J233]
MKRIYNEIKKIFAFIGQVISLVFIAIYDIFIFILDNTIGFFFTKEFRKYKNKYKKEYPLWLLVRKIISIIILLIFIFGFKFIYEHTFEPILGSLFVSIGKVLGEDIYGKVLVEFGARFAQGIGTTLYLSLIGTTIGFFLAIILSTLVTTKVNKYDSKMTIFFKKFGTALTKTYVTIVRGTPMMVQAMLLYWGVRGFLNWDFLIAGLATVSINTTAYLTEVLRGGIESIDKGQTEGALSLGLSKVQTMISVIYPQAIKNSMAAIGNEFVINIKDTSVLSVIMVVDIFRVSQLAQAKYLSAFPPFIIAAVIYLVLTSSVSAILRRLEKRLDIPTKNLPSSN